MDSDCVSLLVQDATRLQDAGWGQLLAKRPHGGGDELRKKWRTSGKTRGRPPIFSCEILVKFVIVDICCRLG